MDIRKFLMRKESGSTDDQSHQSTSRVTALERDHRDELKPSSSTSAEVKNAAAPKKVPETKSIDHTDLGTLDSGPAQPILGKFPQTMFGKQLRNFSPKFYQTYPWLEYSVKHDAVFCFSCRLFGAEAALPGHGEEIYLRNGQKNWKKLAEKVEKHATSAFHLGNFEKWQCHKITKEKNCDVAGQLDSYYQEEQARKKDYLGTLFDFVLYFAKQGVALRGHRESKEQKSENRGNFLELCDLYSRRNPTFNTSYEKYHNYTSHDIQKEMISSLSDEVSSKIIKEVKDAGMFSLMLDEARCYKEQQLSFCIRYCTDDIDGRGMIKERFLGFIDVSNHRDATSLSEIVLQKLNDLGLENVLIVAQTYDGANVMSGDTGGLQAKIRAVHPSAIYVHCYAHKLALVVRNTCNDIRSCMTFFNTLESLYVHFAEPGSHHTLQTTLHLLGVKTFEISQLCDTRWICRFSNCQTVLKNFGPIIEALEKEVNDGTDRKSVEASGILTAMKKYDFIVHLVILIKILSTINALSLKFQQENMTLGRASGCIQSTLDVLVEDRNKEEHFNNVWNEIGTFCKTHNISQPSEIKVQPTPTDSSEDIDQDSTVTPPSPKKRRLSRISSKLADFAVTSTVGQKEDVVDDKKSCRIQVYYQIYDHIIGQFRSRFSDESLVMARAIDSFLNFDYDGALPFINHYKASPNIQINDDLLQAEMKILKNLFSKESKVNVDPNKNMNKESKVNVGPNKKMNKESKGKVDPNKKMNPVKFIFKNKDIAPNSYILAKISATIPISSVTAERSFSAMRRIKTWLRTTMTQERFSNLSILHIEKDLIESNTMVELAEKFLERRKK